MEDCEYVFNCIKGYDSKDSTSSQQSLTKSESPTACKGLRVCLPSEYLAEGSVDPDVLESVEAMKQILLQQGCIVEERSLGFLEYVVPTYYVIAFAEQRDYFFFFQKRESD